jgi:hypothetical protein
MARYVARVATPWSPADAFAFMADMRRFTEWDPGIRRIVQVVGDGPGPEVAYDVTVAGFPRDMTLRYVVEDYVAPTTILLVARSAVFTSVDRVTVTARDGGAVVVYDAVLTLNGPLRLGDLGLRPVFNRIGDRAAAGLRRSLDGESLPDR